MNRYLPLVLVFLLVAGKSLAAWDIPDEHLATFESYYDGSATRLNPRVVTPNWIMGSDSFWYAAQNASGISIYIIDPIINQQRSILDASRFRDALAEFLGLKEAHEQTPSIDQIVSADETEIVFIRDDMQLRLDLKNYEIKSLPPTDESEPARQVPQFVRSAFPAAKPDIMEVPSPDGRSYVRDDKRNIFVRTDSEDQPVQITHDGTELYSWTAETAVWSPDGRMLAVQKTDNRDVHSLPVVDWLDPNEKVTWLPYAYSGNLPQSETHIIDVDARRNTRIDTGTERSQFLVPVGWRDGGSEFLFMRLNSTMTRLDLMAADPQTGNSRIILTDRSDTFIEGLRFRSLAEHYVTPLEDDEHFIWIAERDGWRHLYLYRFDGQLVRQLTDGDFPVRKILDIDEQSGWVYFEAQFDSDSPYDRHVCRVHLSGQDLTQLTVGHGQHSVQFSPTKSFFVDTWSSVDRPYSTELRRADGELVRRLDDAMSSLPEGSELPWPEPFVVQSVDDDVDLHGVLYKPPGFDPEKKFPVIDVIYAGPQTARAGRTFEPKGQSRIAQALATLGFVTFIVDARGTPERGKEFQDVAYLNIGRNEIPDHVKTLHQLASVRSYMDLDRVGIYGHSWGGYFTIRAMLLAPEVYRAGVASSPVVELESVLFTPVQPYMLTPTENPEGYAYASNLAIASQLQGRLMLTIGTADVNTPFAQTMRMLDAFIRAGKRVDLQVYPGQNHQLKGHSATYFRRSMASYFIEHLQPEAGDSYQN